jgi:hypothetical protein
LKKRTQKLLQTSINRGFHPRKKRILREINSFSRQALYAFLKALKPHSFILEVHKK